MRRPPVEQRDWLTSTEVGGRFRKSRQAVDQAADEGRLPHDFVMHGTKKERRFPKVQIEAIDRWPGYRPPAPSGSNDAYMTAELHRLRAENAALREEAVRLRTDFVTGEMKIEELRRTVQRQQRVLRVVVEAMADDELDAERLLAILR